MQSYSVRELQTHPHALFTSESSQTWGIYSHVGRRKRNEDNAGMFTLPDGSLLGIVCDGVGGAKGGDYASRKIVVRLPELMARSASMLDALEEINSELLATARETDTLAGMSSTVVAVHLAGQSYRVIHVGDSRAYEVALGVARPLTKDHSYVAEKMALGELTAAEAEVSPYRSALTRSLGNPDNASPELSDLKAVEPPHCIVLCTDGCYKDLSDTEIARVACAAPTATIAAKALAAVAFAEGSNDNITVLVIDLPGFRRESSNNLQFTSIDQQLVVERRRAFRRSVATVVRRKVAPFALAATGAAVLAIGVIARGDRVIPGFGTQSSTNATTDTTEATRPSKDATESKRLIVPPVPNETTVSTSQIKSNGDMIDQPTTGGKAPDTKPCSARDSAPESFNSTQAGRQGVEETMVRRRSRCK